MSEGRPVALVTGASAGIGLEIAKQVAADGYRPLLVARRRAPLERLARDLASSNPIIAALDLTEPDAAIRAVDAAEGAPIRMLINNAGFGTYARFTDTPIDASLSMIDLNIRALTQLTGLCLPGMLEEGAGYVMNVASTAGFMPGPGMATYYATKAFVLSFSEALAREVGGSGVVVSALCPGPTETEFQDVAGISRSSGLGWLSFRSASSVAEIGYRGLKRGKPVVVTGAVNKVTTFLPRVLPRRLTAAIVAAVQSNRP